MSHPLGEGRRDFRRCPVADRSAGTGTRRGPPAVLAVDGELLVGVLGQQTAATPRTASVTENGLMSGVRADVPARTARMTWSRRPEVVPVGSLADERPVSSCR